MAHRETLYWKRKPFPELVRLAWPIAVSMLSYSIMTLTDTLFVGRLGASRLAGVGLGGVAGFAILCFGSGLVRGVKVLVSQAVGAGRRHELPALVGAGVISSLGLGAVVVVVGRAMAHLLPGLSVDPEAGSLAAVYLGIRILGAPLFLLGAALRESRYGMGDTRVPMIAAVVANIANVPLDALLIFGLHLGVPGAAWATVIASAVQTAILLGGQLLGDGLHLSLVRREHLLDLWHIGAPLGVQMLLEVGSFATLVVILARIGEVDLAAHQIALQLTHLSFLPALALGEAASVLTGQAVGAGEDQLVRRVAHRALAASAVYTGACAVGFVVAARGITALFTPDPAVQSLAVKLLYVAAAFQLFDGANVVARSVLRGTGDVRYPAIIAVSTAWLCTPPLTALLAIGLGLGALGGWLGLCAEICVGALLLWWRLERCQWQPWAERSRRRLAQQRRRRPMPVPA
jgi:MATE family multidrug resistance protein